MDAQGQVSWLRDTLCKAAASQLAGARSGLEMGITGARGVPPHQDLAEGPEAARRCTRH